MMILLQTTFAREIRHLLKKNIYIPKHPILSRGQTIEWVSAFYFSSTHTLTCVRQNKPVLIFHVGSVLTFQVFDRDAK